MFVLESTYKRLQERYRTLDRYNDQLLERWNQVVRKINAKGGDDFLENGTLAPANPFSQEDIRRLISLCHPDKHDGKKIAVEMTQKLLSLKE